MTAAQCSVVVELARTSAVSAATSTASRTLFCVYLEGVSLKSLNALERGNFTRVGKSVADEDE